MSLAARRANAPFWLTGSIEKVRLGSGYGTALSTEEKIDFELPMD